MKITVVTVCYNAATLIEETIKSVLSQTHEDLEYIVIDGKSTDGTMETVSKYADRITKIISEPDKGIYDAMNKGISLATGEYINFMNAGDTFSSPDAVKEVACRINPDSDVAYGDSTMIDYKGRKSFSAAGTDTGLLRKKPIYRHNASFTRTSLHKRYPFELDKRAEFRHALDYNNIFNLWHNGAKFQKVDVDVVTWEKQGTSDRDLLNIKLMFKISHQFRNPTLGERLTYVYDCIKACRRDIVRKLNSL
ncbi:MAG: glycosyltransferase [Muribaculaceae bacterium]|nr:glycosyltransferase [Muribaculaceae bacterium]MDE6552859.1 glycosyltransferase [Muribaculaceae bacterium]